jgi:hypothetical protein
MQGVEVDDIHNDIFLLYFLQHCRLFAILQNPFSPLPFFGVKLVVRINQKLKEALFLGLCALRIDLYQTIPFLTAIEDFILG